MKPRKLHYTLVLLAALAAHTTLPIKLTIIKQSDDDSNEIRYQFLCKSHGTKQGAVNFTIKPDNKATIENLYVGKEFRHKGLGSSLLTIATTYMKRKMGITHIGLCAQPIELEDKQSDDYYQTLKKLIAWYEKHNFKSTEIVYKPLIARPVACFMEYQPPAQNLLKAAP